MKRRKKQSKYRKLLYISLSILFVLAIYLGMRGFAYYTNMQKSNISVHPDKKEFLFIYKNDGFDDVVKKLEKSGAVKNMKSFISAAEKLNYPNNIVLGRYELVDGMSNRELLRKLINGRQTPTRLTFNNIRTKEALAQRLSSQLYLDSAAMINVLNDREILSGYGLIPATAVSLFIPNTYEIYWDISPENLLKRMKKEYDTFWTEERLMKLNDVGLDRLEVSILASIVEEETKKRDEKPVVAGLYLNRINKRMPLQADPTVKFALQDFSLRRIYYEHLTVDSPYNTYKYAGLPPGPIRIPSIESIDAVLNYQAHNYLYMCAKEDFSGCHNFAATLQEHNKNAAKYRQESNRRGIK
jgi:UPF0755 protein